MMKYLTFFLFENEDKDLKNKIYFWFALALIFHLITPILSVGYFHPDEHFQILEFLGVKLYGTPTERLAWEYNSHIRPWFQIFTYYVFIYPFKSASPFHIATTLRIFSSLLAFVSTIFMTKTVFSFFKKDAQKHYWLIFLTLLWFIPYVHARTSSDNFATAIFFIGLYFFLKREKLLLSGLLLGFSFITRFQMGLLILPLFIWAQFIGKYRLKELLITSSTIILAIGLGVLIDYWGYGLWVFTPWNYFKANIVDSIASNYGTGPIWDYFKLSIKRGGGPIGIILLLSMIIGWKNNPKHVFTWISAPFFIIHCLIPHKELRFLLPLYPVALYYLVLLPLPQTTKEFFGRKSIKALMAVNIILLMAISLTPSRFGVSYKKYIYDNSTPQDTIYFSSLSPYEKFHTYYNIYIPKVKKIIDKTTFDNIPSTEKIFWYGTRIFPEITKLMNSETCELKKTQYPKFFLTTKLKKFWKKNNAWALFKCRN